VKEGESELEDVGSEEHGKEELSEEDRGGEEGKDEEEEKEVSRRVIDGEEDGNPCGADKTVEVFISKGDMLKGEERHE
jgi:hypothetical protein